MVIVFNYLTYWFIFSDCFFPDQVESGANPGSTGLEVGIRRGCRAPDHFASWGKRAASRPEKPEGNPSASFTPFKTVIVHYFIAFRKHIFTFVKQKTI